MGKSVNPQAGVFDVLGSQTNPWVQLWVNAIQNAAGKNFLMEGFDLSKVGSGILNPNFITNLLSTTTIDGNLSNTLASLLANSSLGASDPAARINAGATLLSGTKIAPNSIPMTALSNLLASALTSILFVNGGGFQSNDYDGSSTGFKITEAEWKVFMAAAVFAGILQGTINIAGKFLTDNLGNSKWNDPGNGAVGLYIDEDGHVHAGADSYANANFQIDPFGNFYLNDMPGALSRIDLGCIDLTSIKAVQPSQAGGQFSGMLTLTPLTRGAQIYYTTDGSDPTSSGTRALYSGPFSVAPVSSIIVKAVCYKIVYGPITSWTFTASANTAAAPTFNPIPGFYTTPNPTYPLTLSSGTPGATITYTTDGSTPVPGSNGTVYVGTINLARGVTTTVKAISSKAGLVNSAVVTGAFTIKKGSTVGSGGGGNQ